MQPSKSDLRKQFNAYRRQLTPDFRHQAAQAAATHLIQHPLFQTATRIACYLAYRDEFLTQTIIEAIWNAKKQCYLPVITDSLALQFFLYEKNAVLKENQFGIGEPTDRQQEVAVEALDLVLLPLLAYDKQGHRLGTGGGFYDKTFACLHDPHPSSPTMIGLGFAGQEAESLPTDPWDILLDGALTEAGLTLFVKP